MSTAFQQQPKYAFGKIAETYIAIWLRRERGFSILPIYEKEIDGEIFIGVWKESDPQKRINWMRKNSVTKT